MFQGFGGISTRFSGELLTYGFNERLLAWEVAVRAFLENPVTGLGYTGLRYLAFDYFGKETLGEYLRYLRAPMTTAGNQYLQLAAEGGVLALVSYGWMMLRFLGILRSAMGHTEGQTRNFALAGCFWLLSLLIGNQTASWLLPGSVISYLLWLIMGLTIAADQSFARARNHVRRQQGINEGNYFSFPR